MPIDTSIPLQVKPVQVSDPLNALARVTQITGMQDQQAVNLLKAGKLQREAGESNALLRVMGDQSNFKNGRLDLDTVAPKLYGAAPTLAGTVIKGVMEQRNADQVNRKAEFDQVVSRTKYAGQLAGSITDPESHQRAVELAGQAGINPSIFGDTFDPARIRQVQNMALTAEQQLEQQRKQRDYELDVTKADEAARHNRSTEGIQAGTLAEGRRHNQSMEAYRGAEVDLGRVPPGYRRTADGKALEAIPGGPAATGKALPVKLVNDLGQQAGIADSTERFVNTFKDQYGGHTIVGEGSNIAGRVFGDDTGQAQWWQDYAMHEATVRNKLFGASLTPGEQSQWTKLTITPRMDAGQIKANLARRAQIERTALDRMMHGAAAGGYSREQIEAVTGRPLPGTPAAGTATSTASQGSGAQAGWSIKRVN